MKIEQEVLEKARAINKAKHLESKDALKEVLKAGLCPKCGDELTFKRLPRPQTYDDVLLYGEWNCSNKKCNYKLTYDEKERLFG